MHMVCGEVYGGVARRDRWLFVSHMFLLVRVVNWCVNQCEVECVWLYSTKELGRRLGIPGHGQVNPL